MTDAAVLAYRKRRAARLAARKLKPKQTHMGGDVTKVKIEPPSTTEQYRSDAPADGGEEEQQNNGGRRGGGGSSTSGGGHGNTKLPFGLCKKFGIEIGDDWKPRDAWDALAGKGITPDGVFRKLKAGEKVEPEAVPEPPKEPVKTLTAKDRTYSDLKGYYSSYARRGAAPYRLEGTPDVPPEEFKYYMRYLGYFYTKNDMMYYLKEHGVEEFVDPDTGETVNPQEMELPERIFQDSDRGYSALGIGMKKDKYAITGTDLDGKKRVIAEFRSLADAEQWMQEKGISEDKVKYSPSLKKREKERVSWLTSDKREYMTVDGVRYGDLTIKKADYGMGWTVTGQDENGNFKSQKFNTRTELMKFLQDQGVEKVREGKESLNPKDWEIPPTVAVIGGKSYQKLVFTRYSYGDSVYLRGVDLDGESSGIEYTHSGETFNEFKERIAQKYGVSPDIIEADEETQKYIDERVEKEQEQDRRRKEFESKAISFGGGRYMDVELRRSEGTYPYILYGYDEHGRECVISRLSDMTDVDDVCIDPSTGYGLNPNDIIKDSSIREEYDKLTRFKAEFEAKKVPYKGKEYADIELVREGSDFRLIGYDKYGRRHRLTAADDFGTVEDEARRYGGVEVRDYIHDEDIRKEFEAYEVRSREFEEKAITVGGYKYADVEFEEISPGKFALTGYTKMGSKEEITYGKDLDDALEEARRLGVNPEGRTSKIADQYAAYKKATAEFESKSKPFGDERYLDIELDYSPEDGHYVIRGTDKKGVRKSIMTAKSASLLSDDLATLTGGAVTMESLGKTEAMKERDKELTKARFAIASGDYYDFDVDGKAFKNIRAEKRDGKWSIMGKDQDGNDVEIKKVDTWDDAIGEMEDRGVRDYQTVGNNGKAFGRPTDGMRHVLLMRSQDGNFKIYADTDSRGTHAEVHTCATENEAREWLSGNNIDEGSIKTRGMNPNDDVPRAHTAKSMTNFDTHRMQAIEGSFIDDMTSEEKTTAANMLAEIFTTGALRCERSTDSFGGIIENGYKSQIETGKGGYGAAKNKSKRMACSDQMYGHGKSIGDTEYEKCGYLGLADDKEDYDDGGLPGYGGYSPCVYTFRKDRMKDRVSYTMGDSLNTYSYGYLKSAGYCSDKPTIEGLTAVGNIRTVREMLAIYQQYKDGTIGYTEMFKHVKSKLNNSYIELQYNGDVTVEDIEKVTFRTKSDLDHAFGKMSENRRKTVIKKLVDNGVSILYRNDRWSPFEDAWDYLKRMYPGDFEI